MNGRNRERWGSDGVPLSRRRWLVAVGVALGTGRTLQAQTPKKTALSADEERVIAAVRERAKKAGIGPFEVRTTEHFIGVGDAPPREYLAEALGLCESFAREFLPHFRERGFAVEFPKRRMTVVGLRGGESYQSYSGRPRDTAVGGHYDIDTNELVVFDFRPDRARLGADAERINTFTLIHETAHLLCYNTGLLEAGRDIPVAISEGLATYAEMWTPPRDRTAFGRSKNPRLGVLADSDRWIPVARLLADDGVFDAKETEELAYAEAWLLVHYLVRQPEMLPKFRAYLTGMPKPGAGVGREAHAEKTLGSLKDLDAKVHRHAGTVARSRRR